MAKYQVNFICGHTETVQLFGKTSERGRWIEWAEQNKVCHECYEKEKEEARQAATQAAAQEAVENGLPPLIGSEKQVPWAERIRAEKLTEIDRLVAPVAENTAKVMANPELLEKANRKAMEDGFADFADSAECLKEVVTRIKGIDSAKWWIDNRDENVRHYLLEMAKKVAKEHKEAIPVAIDAKAEATVRPESPLTETVAEIRVHEKSVEIVFPEKREDFWQIVKKQLGYTWSGSAWTLAIGVKTGSAADRAAEAGNRLLSARFIVRIFDHSIREAAINATYEPRCDRWITRSGTDNSRFLISWGGRDEMIYDAARKLKGSKYNSTAKAVAVPPEQFAEVLDFAQMYEFRLSPGAQEIADQARQRHDSAMVAKPVQTEPQQLPQPGDKPAKLPVPEQVEVADEFKD